MIRHLLAQHDVSQKNHQCTGSLSPNTLQSQEDVKKTFEKNFIRWIVAEDMAFSSVESPFFQQMINEIPGLSIPFTSRNTLASRISAEFELDRAQLVEELAASSNAVALSLDGWTSSNDVSILAVIGHWLSADFVYKEAVIEFAEIEGAKTGENMGGMVFDLLKELNINTKLLSITADNASNNKTLMDAVENSLELQDQFSNPDKQTSAPRFQGRASFVRCLAHILNIIVKKLLETLKSGNRLQSVPLTRLKIGDI